MRHSVGIVLWLVFFLTGQELPSCKDQGAHGLSEEAVGNDGWNGSPVDCMQQVVVESVEVLPEVSLQLLETITHFIV